jgi:hypothetical protein
MVRGSLTAAEVSAQYPSYVYYISCLCIAYYFLYSGKRELPFQVENYRPEKLFKHGE